MYRVLLIWECSLIREPGYLDVDDPANSIIFKNFYGKEHPSRNWLQDT